MIKLIISSEIMMNRSRLGDLSYYSGIRRNRLIHDTFSIIYNEAGLRTNSSKTQSRYSVLIGSYVSRRMYG